MCWGHVIISGKTFDSVAYEKCVIRAQDSVKITNWATWEEHTNPTGVPTKFMFPAFSMYYHWESIYLEAIVLLEYNESCGLRQRYLFLVSTSKR